MTLPRALLLDSTFLIGYEREKNPRLAEAVVVESIVSGRLLIVCAASLICAGAELGGRPPELSWVLNDPAGPIEVLTLSAINALDAGQHAALAGAGDLASLEVAQVVLEAASTPTVVMTYEPGRYAGQDLHVMDMRPR